MRLNEKQANEIYNILVDVGGADGKEMESFIYAHVSAEIPCTEWRFRGKLGFGGKYRSDSNIVDFYKEDTTPERVKLVKTINEKLSKISS